MLRSMLEVRYGWGCSGRVTAWAARPSRSRSRQRNSSAPSSGVSRPPSAAFDKIRSVVADIVGPLRGEPEFGGQLAEPGHPDQLPRAEVVADDVREVSPAVARVEPE